MLKIWRKPKMWQVYAQHQTTHRSFIRCEHRFFFFAELCCGLLKQRGEWFYDIQCRAGCRFCFTSNYDSYKYGHTGIGRTRWVRED